MADQELKEAETQKLVELAADGDNDAWQKLYNNFKEYIEILASRRGAFKTVEIDDLIDAGMRGFFYSVRNYDAKKSNGSKFITYATTYINNEINHELEVALNPLGLKMPEGEYAPTDYVLLDPTDKEGIDIPIPETEEDEEEEKKIPDVDDVLFAASDKGGYSETRRAIQIMEVLKNVTDDDHGITKEKLADLLRLYRAAKYGNAPKPEADNTLTKSVNEILAEVDPLNYSKENDDEYLIRYSGNNDEDYKNDLLDRKINKKEKNITITDFRYHHAFSNAELDDLIRIVCMSTVLTDEEKNTLISRLVDTASNYYRNSLWDGEKIKFDPSEIHGRYVNRGKGNDPRLIENIRIIQDAINNFRQVTFFFNRHTDDHKLEHKNGYRHRLSPYHLVVYHDLFYCIGLKREDKDKTRIWHYRLDLMSDIETYISDGKPSPIELKPHFEGLPVFNASWQPDKYMAEHLNMGYDTPRDIWIKIPDDGYNVMYDWFADYYRKIRDADEDGYDIVSVTTSPNMIVHWAMQYGDYVEIMDEDIREKVREEAEKVARIYRKQGD